MYCSVKLSSNDFKQIHNGLYSLDDAIQNLEDVLKPELYLKLVKASNLIRDGLKDAYDQESKDFDRKNQHFSNVAKELGLKNSTWSMYEVDNLSERHPYDVDTMVYRDHWGDKPVVKEINGSTWAALFVAADACIRDSGDGHHVYIEKFTAERNSEGRNVLILSTGS